MAWKFVLCELDTVALGGAVIGAIENAYDRHVTLGINGLGTASCRLDFDNPRAVDITDREGDVLLKVYQGTTLRLVAECVSAEESWDADRSKPTLACTFANPLWRLAKRLYGTGATGEGITPSAARDTIVYDLITTTNAQKDTGVRNGAAASLRTTSAGPWAFKPVAEAMKDMSESFAPPSFETVITATTNDTFVDTPGTVLTSHLSTGTPSGDTWNSAGSTTDWTIDTTGQYLQRVKSSADTGDGRHGILGPTHPTAAVLVQATIFRDGTMGSPATLMGLLARYVNSTNYLRFTVTTELAGSQAFRLTKMVGGVSTNIWYSSAGTILDPTPFYGTMRMVVDATGRYALWWWPTTDTSYQADPIMVGYDSDLDAGGTLANGSCGIYNFTGGTGSPVQGWDNYGTATPANSLDAEALEFELAPSEPTADSNQSGVVGSGVKVATLNVSARIGTDKPTVIFEQGDGIRTMKSYKRAISKDAQMNRGYVLPSDATPWPAGAMISREDATSILERGLFEDVVATDAGAAKGAVLDLHLQFRKQARQVVTFDPSSTARYTYGKSTDTPPGDYVVGDQVTGRAKYAGASRFNGLFRIFRVDIEIDDNGNEVVTPTLTRDDV